MTRRAALNGPTIHVAPSGEVQAVYDERLDLLGALGGQARVRRASHVEPTTTTPSGTVAWTADLSPVDGPVLGPFRTRAEALAAEVDWLNDALTERALPA